MGLRLLVDLQNMAALDGLPDKIYGLRMKQYGDNADQKVIDKRVENVRIVNSMLIRDTTLR